MRSVLTPRAIRALILAAALALAGCVSEPKETTPAPEPPAEKAPAPEKPAKTAPAGEEPRAGSPAPEAQPDLRKNDWEFGKKFLPLTREFALTEYVSSNRTASGGVLYEYLPQGEGLESWTHLGTVIVLKAGTTWEEGRVALPKYSSFIAKNAGELYGKEVFRGRESDVYFVHFRLGQGTGGEYSLMANWQIHPGLLASFQVQQRPEAFSARQVAHFRQVVRGLGGPEPSP